MIPHRSATTHSETLNDEMCVYEWTNGEVHALNPTAARVWQMCDGHTSVSEMATSRRSSTCRAEHWSGLRWLSSGEAVNRRRARFQRPSRLRGVPDRAARFTAAALPIMTPSSRRQLPHRGSVANLRLHTPSPALVRAHPVARERLPAFAPDWALTFVFANAITRSTGRASLLPRFARKACTSPLTCPSPRPPSLIDDAN